MNKTMKTSWRKTANYRTQEIKLDNGLVIYKDYWDPGKNPNITKISFEDFINGKFNDDISSKFNNHVLKEVLENIKLIQANASGYSF